MGSRKASDHRVAQVERSLTICRDTLRAISANGDLHSSWAARKALHKIEHSMRRANV